MATKKLPKEAINSPLLFSHRFSKAILPTLVSTDPVTSLFIFCHPPLHRRGCTSARKLITETLLSA